MTEPLRAEDLVHVGESDGVLLQHVVAEHVPRSVLTSQLHSLKPFVAPSFPAHKVTVLLTFCAKVTVLLTFCAQSNRFSNFLRTK